jgi:DNA-binding transcriptional LysR family regulator
MDTRHLRAFVAVAEKGNFTRAALDLAFAQSTVTAQVQALEREIGVDLFDRLPNGVRLSSAGERFLPYARRILGLTTEARQVSNPGEELSGTLVIGAMESITAYRLLPVFEFMHLRHPGVRLSMRPSLFLETEDAVRSGSFDAGFVVDARTSLAGLDSEVLCEEPLVLVASSTHKLVGERGLDLSQLRQCRVVSTEPGCAYRDAFEQVLRTPGADPFPLLELGTIDAIKRSVSSGMGIALLPRVAIAADLKAGNLVCLDWQPPFTVYTQLVWRRGQRLLPALAAVRDAARRVIDEQNA